MEHKTQQVCFNANTLITQMSVPIFCPIFGCGIETEGLFLTTVCHNAEKMLPFIPGEVQMLPPLPCEKTYKLLFLVFFFAFFFCPRS